MHEVLHICKAFHFFSASSTYASDAALYHYCVSTEWRIIQNDFTSTHCRNNFSRDLSENKYWHNERCSSTMVQSLEHVASRFIMFNNINVSSSAFTGRHIGRESEYIEYHHHDRQCHNTFTEISRYKPMIERDFISIYSQLLSEVWMNSLYHHTQPRRFTTRQPYHWNIPSQIYRENKYND